MTIDFSGLLTSSPTYPENKSVVRVSTSYWSDNRGIHTKKSITTLRKQSSGYNLFDETLSAIGAEDSLKSIVNLDECGDGVYEVVTCNESRDFESGHIDDYDLKLVRINLTP